MVKTKTKKPGSGSTSPTNVTPPLRSPEKKPRVDGDDHEQGHPSVDVKCLQGMFDRFAIEVAEKLNKQLMEGFERQNSKIDSVAKKAMDMDQELHEMQSSVSSSHVMAQQALQAVNTRKSELSSKAPSEASTEVPPQRP